LIVHAKSGKVLEVPWGIQKDEEKVVIYPKNRRINQRWYFKKKDEGKYEIRSVVSSKYLDIYSEARASNSRVIQFKQTNLLNQLWMLENVGNSLFIIRSVHEPSLVMGLHKNSSEDGNTVAVVDYECLWRIDGYFPR
jgi:hypothetical protein